ncbi:hypothetical protein ACFSCX_15600 [Bacillus salitolerans]|uniref:DUF3899 domain-containing protein n=1 Tax=Bacillus salitolerans TaxID=1437434 RepID=A0ABW4LSX0_9BACI
MKNIVRILITLSALLFVNYIITLLFSVKFIDFAFVVGLLGIICIKFFSSTGGYTSRQMDVMIQAQTGIKQDEQKQSFTPSISFYTAIIYTVVSAVATAIYYKDYFIG